ncbi:hypothetical protein HUW46_02993 [Amycolatopsis sp. CA-230715]|nr:MerR family transcriptional regulator [Amycolatopsis sp. CA-230715]QWF79584.1 hypothetical protein HUW46_02993 [Amycolatopsis sp. CA-230715]
MGSDADTEPTMPVASVARRLGVAPSTLRTWDRRYGLGPSRHTDGRHRRYGASDIGRLELMQRALLRGASTAEAARYALEQMPKSTQTLPVAEEPRPKASVRIDTPAGAVVLPAEESGDGDPLGASRLARRVSTAALAMDGGAVQRLLASGVADLGALTAWEVVFQPVLTAFSPRWRGGEVGAEVEKLLAECVLATLLRATPVLDEPRNHRPVLLCGVPDERDTLALYALAAGLAGRGIGTQVFSAPLQTEVLAIAVRRSEPSATVLWAQRAAAADPALFSRVSRGRNRSRLFACGPGWQHDVLPAKVEVLGDLPSAADRIEYVLLGRARRRENAVRG